MSSVAAAAFCAAAAVYVLGARRSETASRLRRTSPRGPGGWRAGPGLLLVFRAACTTVLGHLVGGWMVGAAVGAAVLVTPAVRRRRAATAALDSLGEAGAAACVTIAAELRAGQPAERALALAVAEAPPALAELLQPAVLAARLGTSVPAALRASAESGKRRRRSRAASAAALPRQLAAAWELTERSGAGLADLVSTLGDSLRAAERLRRESAAAMAGPTTTAWLLAGLPAVGVVMGLAMGADPLTALTSPVGAVAAATGVALDVLGLLWVRRLLATSRNAG